MANAAPSVDLPWIRMVPGQANAAGYMTITSAEDATLVSATSDCCDAVEIHEMTMDGDVMRMREVSAVKLPSGTPVAFAPLGYHLMLMGIKQPPANGGVISINLTYGSGTSELVPFTVKLVGADHSNHNGHH